MDKIRKETELAIKEFFEKTNLKRGDILVIGCSSSEILGENIGSHSSLETAEAVFEIIYKECNCHGVYLAAQCCEHLNRAIIVERECAEKYSLEEVNVIPQPKAGGSFASSAYRAFKKPAAVEQIRAHAGIDIGDTLIGMHMRPVAVPLRLSVKKIGCANLVCARTRSKFVGGSRAVYNEELL